MSDYLDPNNEELLKDFFVEAQLQVEALESNILVLENEPTNHDAIDEIFRAAHTLKGASATVQMLELSEFTHLLEDVLDRIRSDELSVNEDIIDVLLNSIDVIKDMLVARQSGEVYDGDISGLKGKLRELLGKEAGEAGAADGARAPEARGAGGAAADSEAGEAGLGREETAAAAGGQAGAGAAGADAEGATTGAATTTGAGAGEAAGSELSEYDLLELKEAAEGKPAYRVTVTFNEDNPMNTVGGIQVFAALKRLGSVLKTVPDFEKLYDDVFFPTVEYFVATDEDPKTITESVRIPDVTVDVLAHPIDEAGGTSGATPSGGAASAQDRAQGDAAPASAQASPREAASEAEPTPREAAPEAEHVAPALHGGEGAAKAEAGSGEAAAPDEEEALARAGAKAGEKGTSQQGGRGGTVGSVLRVDSKRIDTLLNLVSETVINKATFNQISTAFTESLSSFQSADARHRELLKELFDSLPEYLEQIQEGKSTSAIKKEILSRFGEVYNTFDTFYGEFKGTVGKFRSTAQNLGRITGELQEGVMRIRMVPISQIFSRFPRLVRDLSKSLKKKVNLEIHGEDTELDKSVIEDLLDPLIHAVRNSIDHGIETPAARAEAGKSDEGTLSLRASNEGNMIIIEIEDDGKGIDVQSIQRKAVERGLIHRNKTLSDVEAYNLIFDPGFSTAQQITNVSGRGVGLDVVKRQIERLNGSVTVWSEKGVGTRFTVKIPLTLAIIQGLLVRVGGEMYAIPITSVLDSHRIKPSDIKLIDNYEVFNVRDDVVSLLRLNRLFGIDTDENREYLFVVIVGSGDKKMGLVVDSLIGEEDVVIKPLRDHYTNAPGIAGANITGDGTVSLIIDVGQLLELGLKHEAEQRRRRETTIG